MASTITVTIDQTQDTFNRENRPLTRAFTFTASSQGDDTDMAIVHAIGLARLVTPYALSESEPFTIAVCTDRDESPAWTAYD